jgi:hypothetical protein
VVEEEGKMRMTWAEKMKVAEWTRTRLDNEEGV